MLHASEHIAKPFLGLAAIETIERTKATIAKKNELYIMPSAAALVTT